MIRWGTKIPFVVLGMAMIAPLVVISRQPITPSPTVSPTSTATVAGEQGYVSPEVIPIDALPIGSPTPQAEVFGISTITPKIPRSKSEGNWTVKDTGESSDPREVGISYESDDANVHTNIRSSSASSSGASQHTNISVTVNGETKTFEN